MGRILFWVLVIAIALCIGAAISWIASRLGLPPGTKPDVIYSLSGVFTAMYFPRTRLGKVLKQRINP